MDTPAVLEAIEREGLNLVLENGGVRIFGPRETIDKWRDIIAARKPEIVSILVARKVGNDKWPEMTEEQRQMVGDFGVYVLFDQISGQAKTRARGWIDARTEAKRIEAIFRNGTADQRAQAIRDLEEFLKAPWRAADYAEQGWPVAAERG